MVSAYRQAGFAAVGMTVRLGRLLKKHVKRRERPRCLSDSEGERAAFTSVVFHGGKNDAVLWKSLPSRYSS